LAAGPAGDETHPAGSARVVTTARGDSPGILWARSTTRRTPPSPAGRRSGRMNETEWKVNTSWWRSAGNPRTTTARVPRHHAATSWSFSMRRAGLSALLDRGAALTTGETADFGDRQPGRPTASSRKCGVGQVERDHDQCVSTPRFTGEPAPRTGRGPGRPHLRGGHGAPSTASIPRSTRRKCWVISRSMPMTASPIETETCSRGTDPPPAEGTSPGRARRDLGCPRRDPGNAAAWSSPPGTTRTRDAMAATGLIVQAIRDTDATSVKVDGSGSVGVVGRLNELVAEGRSRRDHRGERRESRRRSRRSTRACGHRSGGGRPAPGRRSGDRLFRTCPGSIGTTVRSTVRPKYTHDSSGRIVVEPKDETKKRLAGHPITLSVVVVVLRPGR